MDNDDRQVGRILSRREMLALLGAAGAAILASCVPGISDAVESTPTAVTTQEMPAASATESTSGAGALPSCIVRPELTEGPYFVDEMLVRSDMRSDPSDGSVKEGVPLLLTINVSQIGGDACTPYAGVTVDVWHCDAQGAYSDVSDPGFSTAGQKFLRGTQVTNENGAVQFTTIYPGWYQGRAVHIHFKIRTDPASEQGQEFTSQFFFDDALSDQVHSSDPYASKGQRDMRNEEDGIFQQSGGQLTLQLIEEGEGYAATFDIGLQTV